ncbi:MAG: alpha/beta hydrolase [Cyanobacteria bacterium SIG29]|nr:alpha/beta hydrolase [Cyanobacteria bacterium SIG29]
MKIRKKAMIEIKLKTKDKVTIAVNHYKNGFDSVVILAPGWFMTKDSKSFVEMSEVFSKTSDVLAMDFRGHGKSEGFYTFTSKEINDISTVIEFAKENYKQIYLIGFSLGGALVLIAGSEYDYINKIIAVSAPSCFEKIENNIWRKEAWLPTLQKCELKRWFSIRPSLLICKKIKPIDIVEKIKCPTLFLAGEKDPTVHNWHSEELFKKAICKKNYELFPNCFHAEDLFIQDREKFVQLCTNWLYNE